MCSCAAAASVVAREPHVLSGISLHAALCVPAPSPPLLRGVEVEDRHLLAKRLPSPINQAELKQFVEGVAGAKLHLITPCIKPSNLLLEFSKAPGLCSLYCDSLERSFCCHVVELCSHTKQRNTVRVIFSYFSISQLILLVPVALQGRRVSPSQRSVLSPGPQYR